MPSCVCITHDLSEESRPFKIKLVYGISILLPPPNSPSNNIKVFQLCKSAAFHFSNLFVCLFCSSSLPSIYVGKSMV